MTDRKKLIEVALPLEAINDASAREKSNPFWKDHPRRIHVWWARRPHVTCRAVIFASLVDDPDDEDAPKAYVNACKKLPLGSNSRISDTPRQRLFDFMTKLVDWKKSNNESILETANRLINLSNESVPTIMDPFAGGGTIPLEVIRLGLNTIASDLNPVAVTINRALVEIPKKFFNKNPVNKGNISGNKDLVHWKGTMGLADDIRFYANEVQRISAEELEFLYPKGPNDETVFTWIWARTVKCPNPACGATMPLVTTFWLSRKKGKKVWLEPIVDKNKKTINFEVRQGKGKPRKAPKLGRGSAFKCLVCGEDAHADYIKNESLFQRMNKTLLAIVTEGNRKKNYYSATEEHVNIAEKISPIWKPTQPMN